MDNSNISQPQVLMSEQLKEILSSDLIGIDDLVGENDYICVFGAQYLSPELKKYLGIEKVDE